VVGADLQVRFVEDGAGLRLAAMTLAALAAGYFLATT